MNVRIDNDEEIESLYKEFKNEFLRNTARYGLDEEQRIDIYQDAFVTLYELLKYKKIKIETGLKNYLFGIGKNMILDKIKSTIKERKLQEELLIDQKEIEHNLVEMDMLNPMQERIQTALQQLSESCRKIMILFYFRQYSIEAIMHSMGYLNENVTKSHKSRCLKHLKEIYISKTP
jgi:RNA polymerase sigma-70 factor (ECF subfamily)